jgi:pyrroloquinoline quinone (PQQ) biosynthesis protein C
MIFKANSAWLERLLTVMDRKHHWAWPHFTGPGITREQLKVHYQQEWAVYVRNFPVFLARLHGKNPPRDVREALAENIYEEDTGKLSMGRSHPALFLDMMEGLGFKREQFEEDRLLPASLAYRQWLDDMTTEPEWLPGIAVFTIFVEGSIHDRKELSRLADPKSPAEIEEVVRQHPLVRYHGTDPACMDLIRAHQKVESSHRRAAYEMVLRHARTEQQQNRVVTVLNMALDHWLRYRDGIAAACGLSPSP